MSFCVIGVKLKDGTFHEDLGFGNATFSHKLQAVEKANKVSFGRKRTTTAVGGQPIHTSAFYCCAASAGSSVGRLQTSVSLRCCCPTLTPNAIADFATFVAAE